MDWWVAELLRDRPTALASWVLWVIGSIVLHELGHGWAAIRRGDATPRELGHMTWNPLVHMGWPSLIAFAATGLAWGAMPVNPARLRGRYADVEVALAGPAMNLGLAVTSTIISAVWLHYAVGPDAGGWDDAVLEFFVIGAKVNVLLALFNLIPVPPLDGARILAGVWARYRTLIDHPHASVIGLVLLFLLLSRFMGGLSRAAHELTEETAWHITRALPGESRIVREGAARSSASERPWFPSQTLVERAGPSVAAQGLSLSRASEDRGM